MATGNLSEQEVITLYHIEKLSCSEIANIDGRSATTIYKILTNNKAIFRDKSVANKIFSDRILITLYNLGLSNYQISRLLGIHSTSVVKRFNKIGFCARNKSIAKCIGYNDDEFSHYFLNSKFLNFLSNLVDN